MEPVPRGTRSLGDNNDHHGQMNHKHVDPSWEPILHVTGGRRDPKAKLGGGNSNIFDFHPELWGNDSQFDVHIFQMGWFNHQLEKNHLPTSSNLSLEDYLDFFFVVVLRRICTMVNHHHETTIFVRLFFLEYCSFCILLHHQNPGNSNKTDLLRICWLT